MYMHWRDTAELQKYMHCKRQMLAKCPLWHLKKQYYSKKYEGCPNFFYQKIMQLNFHLVHSQWSSYNPNKFIYSKIDQHAEVCQFTDFALTIPEPLTFPVAEQIS